MMKYGCMIVCLLAFAASSSASVMLDIQTTPLQYQPGYYATVLTLVSNDSACGVITAIDATIDGYFEQTLAGQTATIDKAQYFDCVDEDSHFLIDSTSMSENVGESDYRLYMYCSLDSIGNTQQFPRPFAQIVTNGDQTIDYDISVTTSGDTNPVLLEGQFTNPEPATLGVLMLGGVGLLRRRRR